MSPERYTRLRELFLAVENLEPGARARYLDSACGADHELRAEIESLLRSAATQASFLSAPALGRDFVLEPPERLTDVNAADPAQPGGRPACIGPYRILGVLGRGGMGIVYRAEQDQPRRSVALKVIRPEYSGTELARRFEQECAALARLQHPGIAQIYAAGRAESPQGAQPFFAMELIDGVPLTDFAAQHRLPVRERVALLAQVCDAVEHAHQRGVIHRDLKPANVLVTADGVPKLVDFGVARLSRAEAAGATLCTQPGQLVGTVAYMSPEQLAGDPLAVDGRADIYALGVIGYELLAGRPPLDVAHVTLPEAARCIAEEDPAPLGTWDRTLRGDLEAIFARALEKDRGQRYPTAAALADDLRRYLADEPITARPITTFYQLRKFARRNRPLVAGVLMTIIALLVGLVGTTSQAIRATRERDRAHAAELAAQQQRVEAEQQAAIARAVNDFVNDDLLAAANPEGMGRDITVREALDAASAKVAARFADQPRVAAGVRLTLGQTYQSLGEYELARGQLEIALPILMAEAGPDDVDTLAAQKWLGLVALNQGRLAEAEPLLFAAFAGRSRLFGPDHAHTLAAANHIALLRQRQARYDEAEEWLLEILARNSARGDQHMTSVTALANLAELYIVQGEYTLGEALLREQLDQRLRAAGETDLMAVACMHSLAGIYTRQGWPDEAAALLEPALAQRRLQLGRDHPRTLGTANNLAIAYKNLGRWCEAEELLTETLAAKERMLGRAHPQTLNSINNLANLYATRGDPAAAEPLLQEVVSTRRRVLGDRHAATLSAIASLAGLYRDQERYAEAEPLALEHYAGLAAARGPAHEETRAAAGFLSELYTRLQRPQEAASWHGRQVEPAANREQDP